LEVICTEGELIMGKQAALIKAIALSSVQCGPFLRGRKILVSSKCPPLTNSEFNVAFREGATDAEIEAKIRDLFFWSYIVRNPFGKSVLLGEEPEQTASKTRSSSPTSTRSTASRRLRT
jgi:hypothetical protein